MSTPKHRVGSPALEERVRAALRREGQCDAVTLAHGLGSKGGVVHGVLARGVAAGWARVEREGRPKVFAFVAGQERAQ